MSIDMSLLYPRFAEKLQELEAQCRSCFWPGGTIRRRLTPILEITH